jgi:hypothetical protein
MVDETREGTDDLWTVIAVAAVVCMLGCVLHEVLGHGGVAYFSGARTITLSTVAMNADIDSRWIQAAGTLVNLAAGAVFWLLLRSKRYTPVIRRNGRWIGSAEVLLVLFVFVLGRGLTWHR